MASAVLGGDAEEVDACSDQGFGVVGLGSDAGMIIRHLWDLGAALGHLTVKHLGPDVHYQGGSKAARRLLSRE